MKLTWLQILSSLQCLGIFQQGMWLLDQRITTIVQNELWSFGHIAKYCFKIWVLGIFSIIITYIRDLYMMQGREDENGNSSGRSGVRLSCRLAKDKILSFNKLCSFLTGRQWL